MVDLIDYTYTNLEMEHIIPSFFENMMEIVLNSQNGGIWGVGFVLVIALISFLIFKPYSFDRGIVTSSLITWISSFLFLKAGWINNFIFTLCCIYVVVGIWFLYAGRSAEET